MTYWLCAIGVGAIVALLVALVIWIWKDLQQMD